MQPDAERSADTKMLSARVKVMSNKGVNPQRLHLGAAQEGC